jgi:hypothetical protein
LSEAAELYNHPQPLVSIRYEKRVNTSYP